MVEELAERTIATPCGAGAEQLDTGGNLGMEAGLPRVLVVYRHD
jgi:hypothetical protein